MEKSFLLKTNRVISYISFPIFLIPGLLLGGFCAAYFGASGKEVLALILISGLPGVGVRALLFGPSPSQAPDGRKTASAPSVESGRELVHVGRRIKVYVDVMTDPEGRSIRRDMIAHPGAVVILPVIDAEHVCLLRNNRWVVGEVLWEAPAGTLEPGEELENAARRELQEETGYVAEIWDYRGYLFASPGVLDEKLHLFFAHSLTPGPNQPEADEDLHPETVKLDDAVAMCLDGRIKDAKTVTAILLWERMKSMKSP